MLVISLYLLVALAAPLYVLLSKSVSTYQFDLTAFEIQRSRAPPGAHILHDRPLALWLP